MADDGALESLQALHQQGLVGQLAGLWMRCRLVVNGGGGVVVWCGGVVVRCGIETDDGETTKERPKEDMKGYDVEMIRNGGNEMGKVREGRVLGMGKGPFSCHWHETIGDVSDEPRILFDASATGRCPGIPNCC